MGVIRKALVISTGGLAGLVLKESPGTQATSKAAARPARTRGSKSVKHGAKAPRRPTAKAARPAGAKAAAAARAKRPAAAKAPRRPLAKAPPARAAATAPAAASAPAPAAVIAQAPSAGSATIGELERLADLHGRGALTGAEFAAAKAKILGTAAPPPPPASPSEPGVFPAIEANVAAARHLADLAGYGPGQSFSPNEER